MRWLLACILLLLPSLADASYTLITWSWTQGAGSAATEFRVKCGRSTGNYTRTTIVSNPADRSLSIYTATNGKGRWFCTVSAANATDESANGNEVQFVLPAPPMVIMPGP